MVRAGCCRALVGVGWWASASGILEPYHRDVPDEELLDDLKRVATIVGSDVLRGKDYAEHGKFAKTTYRNRFGTW
jgi:hypothetical protein